MIRPPGVLLLEKKILALGVCGAKVMTVGMGNDYYETMVRHAKVNHNQFYTVEQYKTEKEAKEGHFRWLDKYQKDKKIKEETEKVFLLDITFTALLASLKTLVESSEKPIKMKMVKNRAVELSIIDGKNKGSLKYDLRDHQVYMATPNWGEFLHDVRQKLQDRFVEEWKSIFKT